MNPLRFLLGVEKQLIKVENFLLVVTVLTMLTLATIQVVLRKFFTALFWADEFNQFMVIYVGFLGAIIAVKDQRHLSIEALTNFLPKKIKPVISILVIIFVIYVTSVLTSTSWEYFQYKVNFEATDLLLPGLPKAYFAVIFPIGFGMILVHYFLRLVELVYNFAGGDKAAGKKGDDLEISVRIKMK